MPEIIYTKIVGVTFDNDDGSNRQAIIKKYVNPFADIHLVHDTENRFSDHAVAVTVLLDDDEKQIGYLAEDLASRLYDRVWGTDCEVEEVTGGEDGKSLGVNIKLIIYTDEELQQQKTEREKAQQQKVSSKPIASPKTNHNASPKSRTVALILCILLGYFGGHQFYAGRKTLGIVYIFTVGLFLVGWIVDLVLIIRGRYKDKAGNYIINW